MDRRLLFRVLRLFSVPVLLAPALVSPADVDAGGVVGNGDPASCTASALNSVLPGGGTIKFNCGPNPKLIVVPELVPAAGVGTTIDGEGKITLSGSNSNRIFRVTSTSALTLTNIVLTSGSATLANPNAPGYGGAIWNDAGNVTLVNSSIQNSSAVTGGGAIHNSFGSVSLSSSSILTNSSPYGGGIGSAGVLSVVDSTIQGNTASSWGAGLYFVGEGSIRNSRVTGNQASSLGGGMYIITGSSASLIATQILSNSVTADEGMGAGIYTNSPLTVTRSVIAGNRGDNSGPGFEYGGGIYDSYGALRILTSTLSGNSSSIGGGIYSDAPLSNTFVFIESSSLTYNVTSISGSGAYAHRTNFITVTNSTVGENSTQDTAGIDTFWSNVTLINDTFKNNTNTGNFASTLNAAYGQFHLRNTVLTSSPGKNLCAAGFGAFVSDGFNLATDSSCGLTTPSDKVVADLKLGPLADNGGPTLTFYPAADSPVRDAGSSPCGATDQRGARRFAGAACDSGSVESGIAPTLTSLTPAAADAGSPGFGMTLAGNDFLPGATAEWNGISRPTIFVGPTQLTASIPASDIAAAGTAQVSARNPGGALERSNSLPFTISAIIGPGPGPGPSPSPSPTPGLFQYTPAIFVNRITPE